MMPTPTIVMSHWSAPSGPSERSLLFWRLAHALACKHYGGVHLITDSAGAQTLGNLGWLSIETALDELPHDAANIWSLGKIKAYGIAAERFGAFVHLDGDVFLWRPLPEWLTSSRVFAQHPEGIESLYDLSALGRFTIAPSAASKRPAFAPNMGITGGTDAVLWLQYASSVLAWVLDTRNRGIWSECREWWGAILAEQWYLGALCEHEQVGITYLFPAPPHDGDSQSAGYTHLLGAKGDPRIAERVRRRLSSVPYDLDPRLP